MSRPTPTARAEIAGRQKRTAIDPARIAEILQSAGLTKSQSEQLGSAVRSTILSYQARMLANDQERPGRFSAAIQRTLKPAARLKSELARLPDGLRLELRNGGLEYLIDDLRVVLEPFCERSQQRIVYWEGHIATGHPAGEGDLGRWLRDELMNYFSKPIPDEKRRRRAVAKVLDWIGAPYPEEKKNKAKFSTPAPRTEQS